MSVSDVLRRENGACRVFLFVVFFFSSPLLPYLSLTPRSTPLTRRKTARRVSEITARTAPLGRRASTATSAVLERGLLIISSANSSDGRISGGWMERGWGGGGALGERCLSMK